jgi:hypothetical protein
MEVDLPAGCISRSKEKWRPLKRVAVAAGGDWPDIGDRLIRKSLAEDEAEREAGLKTQPPGIVLLIDLHALWTEDQHFLPTHDLITRLVAMNPYWRDSGPYGKELTEHRLGRLLSQSAKITSVRPDSRGPRGYTRAQLQPVWRRLKIGTQK